MALKHAKPEDIDELYAHFYACREWFPHIRKDYLLRMLHAGTVVYSKGVIIVYSVYKRKQRLGTATASAGEVILHQILNTVLASGETNTKATTVLTAFFKHISGPVWLTVRSENKRAIRFYLKNRFKKAGTISWMSGALPGTVFTYKPTEINP